MKHRSYASSYHRESSPLLPRLLKYLVLLTLVVGVGGATWIALTPMDAPVQEVVRPIAEAQLGH